MRVARFFACVSQVLTKMEGAFASPILTISIEGIYLPMLIVTA